MKSKIILITIIALSIGVRLFAQDSYQTFSKGGSRVKCGCSLYENSVFIEAAKQQGANNIIAAYICAENQDSPEYGVIANVNVYDESANKSVNVLQKQKVISAAGWHTARCGGQI